MKVLAKSLSLLGSLAASVSLAAVPTIPEDSVVVTQDADTGLVRVAYAVENEAAIVTAELEVGGVSLPAGAFTSLLGEVNVRVGVGSHTFTWNPSRDYQVAPVSASDVKVRLSAWGESSPPPYRVLDLSGTGAVSYYATPDALPGTGGVSNALYKTEKLVFRYIDANARTFEMGGAGSGRMVTFGKDYWIGIYPVTRRQWMLATGSGLDASSSSEESGSLPMTAVSFYALGQWGVFNNWPRTYDTGFALQQLRTAALNDLLDIPTEAQWEFACRAGAEDADGAALDECAWHAANAGGVAHPVGLKKPNDWGLYDMLGNVSELVYDWWQPTLESGSFTDPVSAKLADDFRSCYRGGSFADSAADCSAFARNGTYSWSTGDERTGLRLSITLQTARSELTPVRAEGILSGERFVPVCASTASSGGCGTPEEPFDTRYASVRRSNVCAVSGLPSGVVMVIR